MRCRDGHDSTTADFCSECGLELGVAAPGAFDHDLTPVPSQLCPVCATDRDDPDSPFCGVCGYNFATKVGGHVVPPAAASPVAAAPPRPRPRAPVIQQGGAAGAHIEIEVRFDESRPGAPRGEPARKFSLYDDESLLGRRSQSVAQTVGLDGDDFISRRQLLIIRQKSGYVARLFDNTNGGQHNGKEMTAGVEVRLVVGDTLSIGSYTTIKVIAIK